MSDDFDFEPVRGLPEVLPAGESLLWQGAPEWRQIALHALHVDWVAGYFGCLFLWRLSANMSEGQTFVAAVGLASWMLLLGAAAIGILCVLAWLMGRTTVYSITTKRVVLRFGVALPLTINLPFSKIRQAHLRMHGRSSGDLPLQLVSGGRISYLALWPHCRAWRLAEPEPMLRCVRDAEAVAGILARGLAATVVEDQEEMTPIRVRMEPSQSGQAIRMPA